MRQELVLRNPFKGGHCSVPGPTVSEVRCDYVRFALDSENHAIVDWRWLRTRGDVCFCI
jgi:hypothetical protein